MGSRKLLKRFPRLNAAYAFTANRVSRRILLNEVQQVAATGCDTLQTHNFVFRFAED